MRRVWRPIWWLGMVDAALVLLGVAMRMHPGVVLVNIVGAGCCFLASALIERDWP